MSEELKNATMEKLLESVKPVAPPPQVVRSRPNEDPLDRATTAPLAEINYPSGTLPAGGLVLPNKKQVVRPTEDEMGRIMTEHGVMVEPEIAAAIPPQRPAELGHEPEPIPASGYSDTYPTHFNFHPSVRQAINRVQSQFPWQTYANTYKWHPPLYGSLYETVSMDLWRGGFWNGKYAGYRGKAIGNQLGWNCFNALFNDPYLPKIYWIIFNGYMYSRTGGWTTSPAGAADSDPRHDYHVHTTFLCWW